ncbi:hypothetical protein [Cryptosporangium aurantiacum]|uniref:Uncharacterized protein n=1 Tax=Cryptosporangium aurantiacum TaxID=134849 RepID=A0A1M7RPU7_9ACTN|nr:hypothetical protein [Cryptosporangium aurantiacum]SHN48078.1 hypothetical protein SAMN05443668_13325 [Cryptosporangium aurantiacum]
MSFTPFLIPVLLGLIVGAVLHFSIRSGQERRAWGDRRSVLSAADRREIRQSLRHGRPVSDRALAVPAIRFGEEVAASNGRARFWISPPRWIWIAGRIFFPTLGALALVIGLVDGDRGTVASGVVLLALTVLYLPVTVRWTVARREANERQLRTSIEANRLLAAS